ncbi:hypothetical protein QFC24_003032 [Naganishia onofrii]|uniref:Uncharacterized protein n=1 Tax=Naganishia onofrii TaxID=1851511 RepID=A0ACC2XMQ7_9TREE|nr:hypothetical protein QFC24_003032 [Naganishia onofrii]
MSLPSSNRNTVSSGVSKANIKRKRQPDAQDQSGITKRRPPMPLSSQGISSNRPAAIEENSSRENAATSQLQAPALKEPLQTNHSVQNHSQPAHATGHPRSQPQATDSRKNRQDGKQLTEKQKTQMFDYLQAEVTSLRARDGERLAREARFAKELRESRRETQVIQEAVRAQQDYRDTAPIVRPVISREDAGDFRLANTRELLGLQIDPEDVGKGGAWTNRGYLKDQCWKLLLAISREVVTWAIAKKDLDPAPVWKKLHRLKKKDIVNESLGPTCWVGDLESKLDIARTIESCDERYQISDLRYPYNNVTISDSYWDNRDTVRRQEDARAWCFKAYKEDPGPRDIHVRLWPPPRASQLTTAVQHLHKNDPSSQQQRQVHESQTLKPREKADATHRGHNDNSTNDKNQRHNGDNGEKLPDDENDRSQNGDETSELSSEDNDEDKDGNDASDNDGDRGENNDGNGNNDDDDLNIGK